MWSHGEGTKFRVRYHDWRMVAFAGVLGFSLTLMAMEIVGAYSVSLTALSIALAAVAGSLLGVCLVGAFLGLARPARLSEQNMQLDAALNNMSQGLCMFDAQNRLLVWNERYRAMYNIDPKRIWRGCSIRDCLTRASPRHLSPRSRELRGRVARRDQARQDLYADRRIGRWPHHRRRQSADQRGGWVAMHEDITERSKAVRELDIPARFSTRSSRTCRRRYREGNSKSKLSPDQSRRRGLPRR